MANDPSKESSLFPSSDGEREDSGLQDILSVAAKLKEGEEPSEEIDLHREDSGLILFSAGSETKASDDDDAVFGFGAGLSGGLGAFDEPAGSSAADLMPLAGEGRVSEARPAEATAKPAAEPKRNPLVAVAVVLGLAIVGVGAVLLTDSGDEKPQAQTQPEMSAAEDAAVGKAEEPTPPPEDPAGASAGAVAAPEPEPEPAADTEGLLAGDTEGLLAMGENDEDPLGVKEGLLENDGSNGVAKAGKWDQGTSYAKPEAKPDAQPEPEEEDDDPLPLPEPKPKQTNTSSGTSDEEVDCLLNPDLAKCQKGGGSTAPKEVEKLAPKLPDKLSSSQLRDGFNTIKSTAKKCGLANGVPPGTQVKVHVSIDGATGTVQSVSATGEYAGTPLGKCVEDAVKNAQFEPFKKPAQGVDYPIVM